MKRLALVSLGIAAALLSSCAIFVVNDDPPRKDGDGDTVSITIIHGAESGGQGLRASDH